MFSTLTGLGKHLQPNLLDFLDFWDDWYFVTEIVRTYCEKKCSSDQGKLLKTFETVKGQNRF